jgi:flagellar protein FlaH
MSQNAEGEREFLKFGNAELDRRIGGIPIPSLSLIEGANDSGKTTFTQQIAYGVVSNGLKVIYFTTEESIQGLLRNMKSLSWDITDAYITGRLKVISINTMKINWEPEISKYYLITLSNYLKKKLEGFNFVVIDSLTHLVTHANPSDIIDFFGLCRSIVDTQKKSFALTIHPYALNAGLAIRMRSFCDGQFLLEKKNFRDKDVLSLTVAKLKGAAKTGDSMITFEVSPAFGIKILPFTSTRG